MQSKKQLILWVLNVLSNESDESRPMTQTKIAEAISDSYPCDRKTVCRNIKVLRAMGYPIRKTAKGFFMEQRVFSLDEVHLVQEAILCAKGKSESERRELADRVTAVLNKKLRREK
ncbi:MAG: hypothetical protein IKT72_00570 [Clostridia bacterium]|nr:hypothetical protein [Clostridia bacterium]